MTTQQMEQIAMLRKLNYSYSFIAWELSLNPNTVKSVCRRNRLEAVGERRTKAEKANAVFCRNCLKPMASEKSSKAVFCSDGCRTIWWRNNRRIIEK